MRIYHYTSGYSCSCSSHDTTPKFLKDEREIFNYIITTSLTLKSLLPSRVRVTPVIIVP